MKRVLLYGIIALFGSPQIAEARNLQCSPRWGRPGRPLVATERAAKAIFIAVEQDFFPQADKANYPDVDASDDGKYWSVWRDAHPQLRKDGSFTSSVGGGQLSFRIDKCDGRIWYVYLTK